MADTSYLQWPFLDESHVRLSNELEAWCTDTLGNVDKTLGVETQCKELVRILGDGGWLRYVIPAEYGGIFESIDVRSVCIIRETLARHWALADFSFAMQGLGSCGISLYGSLAQKREYLPYVVTGEKIAAFALTEKESGSDAAALAMSGLLAKSNYNLSGAKTFISNAGIADFYTVFVRTENIEGAKGISAFVVDATNAGVKCTEKIAVSAPHPLGTITFEDCCVSPSCMLGKKGNGFSVAMSVLDVFRSTVGAAALGFSRRALDEATVRSQHRSIFGAKLVSNAITQSKLAEMALDVDASALLVYRAAWVFDVQQRRTTKEAAMAKLYATESAQLVIDKAVQIFGGLGVVVGVPVEALYREIRALRIYEGASEVQKLIIAKHHLGNYTASRELV